jgi:hypothetical protein
MENIAGYWTGSFEGTNQGGLSLSIDQKGAELGGLATMNEPSIGLYNYSLRGQFGTPIKFQLQPVTEIQNVIFGLIDVECGMDSDGIMVGRWKSSIGSHGVFRVRRYEDSKELSAEKPKRINTFISYSHTDKEFLDALLVHLKPLEMAGLIDAWSDQRIKAGSLWKKEIESALARAQIAILLISPEFLASDFIIDKELPKLLLRAKDEGVKILPVILRTCRFTRDPNLGGFQAINDPAKPLASLEPWERDTHYDKIAHEIEKFNPRT